MVKRALTPQRLLREARSSIYPTSRFAWRGITRRQLDQALYAMEHAVYAEVDPD